MLQRIEGIISTVLTASRWLMAPLYLGLFAALLAVVIEFFRELVATAVAFRGMTGAEVILHALKLVDLVLVANLIQIVIVAGVAAVALRVSSSEATTPDWMGKVDFSGLKLKILASLAAIAAVDLLESFFKIEAIDKADALWEVVIVLTFAVAGVLLAWIDRLTAEPH